MLNWGCDGRDNESLMSTSHGRLLHEVTWDTTFVLESSAHDSTLMIPRLFVADDGGRVYAFDYGDNRLKAFDTNGEFLWIFGQRGKGPAEFDGVTDLEIDHRGRLWLLDTGTRRFSIVSSSGILESQIPIRGDRFVRDVVPLPDRLVATAYTSPDEFLIEYDSTGNPIGNHPYPDDDLSLAFYSTRQTYVTLGPGDRWLALFPFGDLFLIYSGTDLRCAGRLVEGRPFPTTMPQGRPDVWAASGAMSDSIAYVLPNGETENALSVLDLYSTQDCRYIRSIPLPGPFKAVYLRNGTFYLETEDPHPIVLGLGLELERGT